MNVDLHCHSLYSDGALSPAALLNKALAAQVSCFALTDHDTMSGITELVDAAKNKPIRIMPGIELSVRWKLHDIHIVGLNLDIHHPLLTATIHKQHDARQLRAKQIAGLLETLGLADAFQKAQDIAGHDCIGRPHFAQALINAGKVPDMQTAFKRYLARGKPAYVPTAWLSLEEAVTAIAQAGGDAVIAHPLKYKLTQTKLRALISAFKEAGGVGIEVISGDMPLSQIHQMAHLADHFSLLASSGSDYHSDPYSRIQIGQQARLPATCTPIWTKWMET